MVAFLLPENTPNFGEMTGEPAWQPPLSLALSLSLPLSLSLFLFLSLTLSLSPSFSLSLSYSFAHSIVVPLFSPSLRSSPLPFSLQLLPLPSPLPSLFPSPLLTAPLLSFPLFFHSSPLYLQNLYMTLGCVCCIYTQEGLRCSNLRASLCLRWVSLSRDEGSRDRSIEDGGLDGPSSL